MGISTSPIQGGKVLLRASTPSIADGIPCSAMVFSLCTQNLHRGEPFTTTESAPDSVCECEGCIFANSGFTFFRFYETDIMNQIIDIPPDNEPNNSQYFHAMGRNIGDPSYLG